MAIPNILRIDKHYKDMTFVSNVFADFDAESCNFSKNSKINLSNQGVCVGGGGEGEGRGRVKHCNSLLVH